MNQILENLRTLIQVPDLASKKWIYEQYDSQVMNDTIYTKGDAAIVRVHGSNKALAMSSDCTPRYVEADPFEGAKQAVAETYRNISAVGAKPLAITNCLNFGNPEKPEIMGQIVRAIKGITEACKALDYPVVSGNVSLYNETDGKAIQPTPTIGGVGLLKDYHVRSEARFKVIGDEVFVIGNIKGHIDCSLYQREILKIEKKENPPLVDLAEEKKNSEFVRNLIEKNIVTSCHDVSDGGLLVSLFEMSNDKVGCEIDLLEIKKSMKELDDEEILFGEEQSRYVVALDPMLEEDFLKLAAKSEVAVFRIGNVIEKNIRFNDSEIPTEELIRINESVFEKKFS